MKVGDTVQLWSEGAWRKNMVGQGSAYVRA